MEENASYAVAQGTPKPKRRGHVRPRRPVISLDGPGRLRTADVLALLGISHSTLHARLKEGKGAAPAPDGKDGGRNYWNTSTIRAFLVGPEGGMRWM